MQARKLMEFLNYILPKEGISKAKFLKILAIIAARYPEVQRSFDIHIIPYKFGPMATHGAPLETDMIYPLLNDTNYFELSHNRNVIFPRTLEPKSLDEEEMSLARNLLPAITKYKTQTIEELLKETVDIYGFNTFADFHIRSAAKSLEACTLSGLSPFLSLGPSSHTQISKAIHNAEVNMVALRQKIRVLDKASADEPYLFEVELSSIYVHIATCILRIVIAKQTPHKWGERNLQLLKELDSEYASKYGKSGKETEVTVPILEEKRIFENLVQSLTEKDAIRFKQTAQSLKDFLPQRSYESSFWEQRSNVLRVIEEHGWIILQKFAELASTIDNIKSNLSGLEREIKKIPSLLVVVGPYSDEGFLQFTSMLGEVLKDRGINPLYDLQRVPLRNTPLPKLQFLFQDADGILLFPDASSRSMDELQIVFSDSYLLSKTIVFLKEEDQKKSEHLDHMITSLRDQDAKIFEYSKSPASREFLEELALTLYNQKISGILMQEMK